MQIGNIKPKNNLFLAPMAGICDVAFRILCKNHGAGLVYSEFVNVEGLTRETEMSLKMIQTADEERPVGIQIFGTKLDSIAKSCEMLQDKCDLIDFNLGCPVHKVTCTGAGGALLKHPEKIGKIVETMVKHSDLPVTFKLRRTDSYELTTRTAKIIEDAGASAIALHGRTVPQGYTGTADWTYIKAIKETVSIPVIGNGDIRSKEDYQHMIQETGCDAVMVARAAMTNPGIFEEITQGTIPNKIKLFFEYHKLAEKYDLASLKKIKLMAQNMTRGRDGGAKLRANLNNCKEVNEVLELMDYLKSE